MLLNKPVLVLFKPQQLLLVKRHVEEALHTDNTEDMLERDSADPLMLQQDSQLPLTVTTTTLDSVPKLPTLTLKSVLPKLPSQTRTPSPTKLRSAKPSKMDPTRSKTVKLPKENSVSKERSQWLKSTPTNRRERTTARHAEKVLPRPDQEFKLWTTVAVKLPSQSLPTAPEVLEDSEVAPHAHELAPKYDWYFHY